MKSIQRMASSGACTVLTLAAAPAHAHLVETGFGGFYDGVVHIAMTPADLLAVIAIALLAGQHGKPAARWTLLALPCAWLLGAAFGVRFSAVQSLPALTILTFAAVGTLVLLNATFRTESVALAAAAVGLLHGFGHGVNLTAGATGLLLLVGTVVTVFCMLAIVSGEVAALRTGWTRIAVRVAGSWIAAAGLLMLGWLTRPVLSA